MALSLTNNNNNNNNNMDDEWSNFLTHKYDDNTSDDEKNDLVDEFNENNEELNSTEIFNGIPPEPTDIYISTKSKIAYLEQPVDLKIFWNIPVIPYSTPANGVIKKQIKLNSKTPEELSTIQKRLKKELYYDEHIMSHIDNPNGRIKFKDIRKITVGISKKDIMSYRSKKKQAFYNCFVMIIRVKLDNLFREFHIKVFNTGKLEIPGVQSEPMFEIVLKNIIQILQPYHDYTLSYKQSSDTVLINSNFNCGFFINREILYDILRNKYTIQAIYDPCSYPGIQCKFYYNDDVGVQTGVQITTENKHKYKNITEVSFMIFRTGSVLIVGMCDENVLQDIYTFLKALLKRLGCEVSDLGILPDSLLQTENAFKNACENHDLILTSGGVSVGEEDHVKPAVQSLGELHLWSLAIKPGKPFAYGQLKAHQKLTHFIGLPGNPVSSFVTCLLLARPVILNLQGVNQTKLNPYTLRADFSWPKADKRREFLRVKRNTTGGLDLFENQGSGVLTSTVWADGLVDNPPGNTIKPGDTVGFIPFFELMS